VALATVGIKIEYGKPLGCKGMMKITPMFAWVGVFIDVDKKVIYFHCLPFSFVRHSQILEEEVNFDSLFGDRL